MRSTSHNRVLGVAALSLLAPLISVSTAAPAAVAQRPAVWGPEEVVAGGPISYQEQPALVRVRANGSAVAAWMAAEYETDGPLTVARRGRGGAWGPPLPLSAALDDDTHYDLAVGPGGRASVVWEQLMGAGRQILETHLDAGHWTAPVALGDGVRPRTTVDRAGVTTVVWSGHGIRTVRSDSSGTWHADTIASGSATLLRLASNEDGDVVVAWQHDGVVRAALRPHGTAWSPARTLKRYAGSEAYVTDLTAAVDDSGRALVLWATTGIWKERSHEYANHLAWSRSTGADTWKPAHFLTTSLGEDGGSVTLSMIPSGAALATWIQVHRSDSPAYAWAARFRPNGTWTAPGRVTGHRVAWSTPRAWLDGRGVAHVVLNIGWRRVWAFQQRPGRPWDAGAVVAAGRLLDATGQGRHLVALVQRRGLRAVALSVTR